MKNKRISAKERREEQKRLNMEKGKRYIAEKVNIEKPLCEKKEENSNNRKKKTKTIAKKIGLKSTIVTGDKIAVTSFVTSKGQSGSNIEKVTDFTGKEVFEDILYTPRMFNTKISKDIVEIEKKDIVEIEKEEKQTAFTNPVNNIIGKDYIGVKEVLEQEYFVAVPKNDNIHIQIAYNIMDIRKILSLYINNVISLFYNLNRNADNAQIDLIGTLNEFSPYEKQKEHAPSKDKIKQVEELINDTRAYFNYFEDVFMDVKKTKDEKEMSKEELEKKKQDAFVYNFNVLRLLSLIRQLCFHSKNAKGTGGDIGILNIEKVVGKNSELISLLHNICEKSINKVNANFIKNAKNNVFVLKKIYKDNFLLEEYYDYVVRKESRNIGVNLKKLREIIVDDEFFKIKNKEYDTYRNKIYTVLTFILYKEILKSNILDKMIYELRTEEKDEELRDSIYRKYAKELCVIVKGKYNHAIEIFKEQKEREFIDGKLDRNEIKAYEINFNDISIFAKTMLFIAKFLDGKETNELLCALINKLDNIADILEVANQIKTKIEFNSDYEQLNNSRKLAKDLRLIKSIAHLKNKKAAEKGKGSSFALVLDAYNMLNTGVQIQLGSEEAKELEQVLYKTKKQGFVKENESPFNHQFRNFIENNVIKSRWFLYIAKYVKPENCGKFMSNENILRFVVEDLPEAQIKRYYKTITGFSDSQNVSTMRNVIIDKLKRFSIKNTLVEVSSMSKKDYAPQKEESDEESEKEKLKAIVNLYLTVAYLIVKSMVKVNARFSIAFNCLERDAYLKGVWEYKDKNNDYLGVTNLFVNADKQVFKIYQPKFQELKQLDKYSARKKLVELQKEQDKQLHYPIRFSKIISQNIEKASKNNISFYDFRNNVEHLNVVKNMHLYFEDVKEVKSYYGLYCYVLQRLLFDKVNNEEYKKNVLEKGTYSKDLMWQFNLPFAYNLARYKNLSDEGLFYDKTKE